jgi:hypothetical protein
VRHRLRTLPRPGAGDDSDGSTPVFESSRHTAGSARSETAWFPDSN